MPVAPATNRREQRSGLPGAVMDKFAFQEVNRRLMEECLKVVDVGESSLIPGRVVSREAFEEETWKWGMLLITDLAEEKSYKDVVNQFRPGGRSISTRR